MTNERRGHEFDDESGDEKSDVDLTGTSRKRKALYKIGDEVQMDVFEQDHYGNQVQTAKHFFIHNLKYFSEYNRWMYSLDEAEDGQAGKAWKDHRWIAERPLSAVL